MNIALRLFLLVYLCLEVIAPWPGKRAEATEPLVGAIRWDGWWQGNPWQQFLGPSQWHYRIPFYGKIISDTQVEVCSDSQRVMDKEIIYAAHAGLNYWAFCYYHPASWPEADKYNYGWKRYLASKKKNLLNFCLLLQGGQHMGPAAAWPATVDTFVWFFSQPTYQKVMGNRPLLYIYTVENLPQQFGSEAAARAALEYLRQKAVQAGFGSPYIVCQVWDAWAGRYYMDTLGFDAISAYAVSAWGAHQEYPYSDLAAVAHAFWDSCRDVGGKVIPLVSAGWDGRPRLVDPFLAQYYQGPWYAMATPAELASSLQEAIDWVYANPSAAESKAILIYAWNESDEGGWLVPTLSEGTARLRAIKKVLKARRYYANDGIWQ